MTFFPVESIRKNDVDFLKDYSDEQKKNLITIIRKSSDKKTMMQTSIDDLMAIDPNFVFEIIYDMDDFFDCFKRLIYNHNCRLTPNKIINIFEHTIIREDFIFENIDSILVYNPEETIKTIFDIVLKSKNNLSNWIEYFKNNKNLHQRAIFINLIVKEHPRYIKEYFPNLIALFKNDNEIMSAEDVSLIATNILATNLFKQQYLEVKRFILENYSANDIALYLLDVNNKEEKIIDINILEFEKNANILFKTSRTYRYEILKNYATYVQKKLINELALKLKPFTDKDTRFLVSKLYSLGLGLKLERIMDEYLAKSESSTVEFLKTASTSSVFKLGDYVLKLDASKWSYEDVICPNLFLILKNLEEELIRNEEGIVICGIELQKYLSKSSAHTTFEELKRFLKTLDGLGYKSTDSLVGGPFGNNCAYLDTYKDADCEIPELLPDWFKEKPLVLFDRDCIYNKDNKFIKQRVR